MNNTVPAISTAELVIACVPAVIVIALMAHWGTRANTAVYASIRMLVQLMLIGYVLIYLFETDSIALICGVLAIMLLVASWIAIQPLSARDPEHYRDAALAIARGGIPTLLLVTQGVIDIEPWFQPRYVIPLAGMIFASAMNTVSLAAERFHAEAAAQAIPEARRVAFQAAMIPLVNSFLAVGLVTLPGMMTGQVLSGVSPIIAAKYQIVVMTMLFGASGIAAAIYLELRCRRSGRA
jgi:putative ABC transport system permease protein